MQLEHKLDFLLGIYIMAIVCAELLGSKFITIFHVPASVGLLALPLTFVINDIVCEVAGKERARNFVRVGIVVLIILLAYVGIARALPPAGFYQNNAAYRIVFGNSLRVIVASLSAFAISEFMDVLVFNAVRRKWGTRRFWLRNNVSNIIGQLIDTTVFIIIAFYHVSPAYDARKMVAIIVPYWLLKIFFSVVETPFAYAGVKWLRGDTTSRTNKSALN